MREQTAEAATGRCLKSLQQKQSSLARARARDRRQAEVQAEEQAGAAEVAAEVAAGPKDALECLVCAYRLNAWDKEKKDALECALSC